MRPSVVLSIRFGFWVLGFVAAPGLPFAIHLAFSGDPKIIAIALQFAYVPALLLGIPLFFLLVYRGWVRWWHYAVGGFTIGLLEAMFVHFTIIALEIWAIPAWAFGGGVCAVILWAIAIAVPNLLLNQDALHAASRHSRRRLASR